MPPPFTAHKGQESRSFSVMMEAVFIFEIWHFISNHTALNRRILSPCSRVLRVKLILSQLHENFPVFYGEGSFFTIFTTNHLLYLLMSSQPDILRSIFWRLHQVVKSYCQHCHIGSSFCLPTLINSDGYSRNFTLETSPKICRPGTSLVKTGHKYQAIYTKT